MTKTSRFGLSAETRYHLYASVHRADMTIPRDTPAPWLPLRADGEHASMAEFSGHMEAFFEEYLGPEWEIKNPPATLNIPTEPPQPGNAFNDDFMVLGLTGERGVGKSLITSHLCDTHGFAHIHPFNPGKEFLIGYYMDRGASNAEAVAMTYGGTLDLKDRPSPYLPLDPLTGEHYTSRWLMERLGRYMAQVMGLGWTIGTDIRHHLQLTPGARILADSVVYEADYLRQEFDAKIGQIVVPPECRKETGIKAEITNANVALITPDFTVINRMDGVENFLRAFDDVAALAGVDYMSAATDIAPT